MRQSRMIVVLLMLTLGTFGAWLGVRAQDHHTPWPSFESSNSPTAVAPNADQPQTGTVVSAKLIPGAAGARTTVAVGPTVNTPAVAPDVGLPAKLPAELPAQPLKTEAITPVDAPPPLPTPTPIADTLKVAKEPPMAPALPNLLDKVEVPKEVATPVVPEVKLPAVAEPLPSPRRAKSKSPEVPPLPSLLPDAPKVAVPALDKQTPPPAAGIEAKPLSPAIESKTTEVPPPANLIDLPPPAPTPKVPLPIPQVEVQAPTAIEQKPAPPVVTAPVPALPTSVDVKKPSVNREPIDLTPAVKTPEVSPPVVAVPVPAPPTSVDVKTPSAKRELIDLTPAIKTPEVSPPPAPLTTAPTEVRAPAPAARPPAFLIVKPRRVEPPTAPVPPAPSLIDTPPTVAAPLASSAVQVTVEKRGPSILKQGVAATYQIIVRNRGAAASGPVTVVDEVPQLAKVVGGDPVPAQQNDKAIWTLPPLPANSETLLTLELQATGTGEFVGNTTLFVSAASATTRGKIQPGPEATTVSAAALGILVRGPVGGAVGQPVVFEVQITNRGKLLLSELVLHAKLPEGLSHPAGNNIEADVGHLLPGESKTLKMPTTAVRSGRQLVEVKITAAGGAEAHSQASVLITGNGLSLQLPPTSRLLLDRDGELRIDVTNLQAEGLRNVVIADKLPANLEYVSSSDRGIYQASTRTVQWLIDYLPPGETRTVTLRVQGKKPGEFAKEVSARAESLPETRAQSMVQVEGYTSLVLKVTPRDTQPLEVGKDTVCEVRVQNLGNTAATNVQIRMEFPPGLASGHVQGPTGQRMWGRTLIFEPIAKLAARTQAVYHVGVRTQAAGDLRLRTQVSSDQERTPVIREAALTVYRD